MEGIDPRIREMIEDPEGYFARARAKAREEVTEAIIREKRLKARKAAEKRLDRRLERRRKRRQFFCWHSYKLEVYGLGVAGPFSLHCKKCGKVKYDEGGCW